MKRIILLLLSLMLLAPSVFAETVDDVERSVGVIIAQADADTLKNILIEFDKGYANAIAPYEQYRAKILTKLRAMGQSQWVVNYMGKNNRTTAVLTIPYESLISLKDDINLAMWMSAKWQEVTVPQGTWKVGKDIPAGHWSVKCAPGARTTQIDWGEELAQNGEDISWSGRSSSYNTVYNKKHYPDADNYLHVYSFEVKDGDYIKVSSGSAVFMPYVGKPSFTFK